MQRCMRRHMPTHRYFERLFPQLLLACFAFALEHCAQDASLRHHFPDGLCAYPFAADIMAYRLDPERTWVNISTEPLRVGPHLPWGRHGCWLNLALRQDSGFRD